MTWKASADGLGGVYVRWEKPEGIWIEVRRHPEVGFAAVDHTGVESPCPTLFAALEVAYARKAELGRPKARQLDSAFDCIETTTPGEVSPDGSVAVSIVPSEASIDYVELGAALGHDDFIAACTFPFLVGAGGLVSLQSTGPTQVSGAPFTIRPGTGKLRAAGGLAPLVLAVRKSQALFANVITVGRTTSNDIVLSDPRVSKVHAFFRKRGEQLEIADAGSTNGTWRGSRRLPARGTGEAVVPGDIVRFGQLDFRFLDASGCWDELRRLAARRVSTTV